MGKNFVKTILRLAREPGELRVVLDELAKEDLQGKVNEASKVVWRVSLGKGARVKWSTIRGPVVIGQGTVIEGSFIGPYTSIGNNCTIENAVVEHSAILDEANLNP